MVLHGAVDVVDGRVATNPEAAFLARERGEALLRAMRDLSEYKPEIAITVKWRAMDLPAETIARLLGLSRITVSNYLQIGVAFLRRRVEVYLS